MKEGWRMVNLGEACEKVRNIKWTETSSEHLYQYIDLTSVDRETSFISDTQLINSENAPSRAKQPVIKGDILFATTRPTLKRVCVIPYNYDGAICSTGFCVLRPKSDILSNWIYYALKDDSFMKYIMPLQKGASYPAVTDRDVKNFKLPLPPLEEQHRIVSILDASFEKIDALKKNAEENLKNAKALFQQVLAQELKPKEGWVEKKLTDISDNLDYKRVPITKNVRKSGKFPYYGASGIVDYVNDYLYDEDLLLISEDGANLLARTTPIAFSVSGKIWVNNHAHVLRFNNLTLQKFVEYFIAGFNITPYVTGMAQPKLNQKALEKIIISFPTDIEEQHRIVQTLDTLSEKCRRLEQVAQQTIRECGALKQSILRQAFSGEL